MTTEQTTLQAAREALVAARRALMDKSISNMHQITWDFGEDKCINKITAALAAIDSALSSQAPEAGGQEGSDGDSPSHVGMPSTTPRPWTTYKPEGAPYYGIRAGDGQITVAGTSSGLSEGDAKLIVRAVNAHKPGLFEDVIDSHPGLREELAKVDQEADAQLICAMLEIDTHKRVFLEELAKAELPPRRLLRLMLRTYQKWQRQELVEVELFGKLEGTTPVDQAAGDQKQDKSLARIEVEARLNRPKTSTPTVVLGADGDGWIPWGGGECPVAAEQWVAVRIRTDQGGFNEVTARRADQFSWSHKDPWCHPIVAYKLAQPSGEPT